MKKLTFLLYMLPTLAMATAPAFSENESSNQQVQQDTLPGDAETIIRKNITAFSSNLVAGNYEAVVAAYTDDAKIFPPSQEILAGSDSIRHYWTPPADSKNRIIYHKVTPEEISIVGNTAYDWGYYEGTTQLANGEKSNWRGKYVIVWKEVAPKVWKIYLDCWNRAGEKR